jgi:hypothetical protein
MALLIESHEVKTKIVTSVLAFDEIEGDSLFGELHYYLSLF